MRHTPTPVYALCRIRTRFPSPGVEREFSQAMGVAGTVNLTDSQVSRRVLEQNPYLARQVCYVAECAGIDTYIVRPRDRHDISLLVETQRSNPSPGDVDLLAGMRGPVAPPYMCNGLTIPIVEPYAIYSFTRQSLIDQIPQPEGIDAERFRSSPRRTPRPTRCALWRMTFRRHPRTRISLPVILKSTGLSPLSFGHAAAGLANSSARCATAAVEASLSPATCTVGKANLMPFSSNAFLIIA